MINIINLVITWESSGALGFHHGSYHSWNVYFVVRFYLFLYIVLSVHEHLYLLICLHCLIYLLWAFCIYTFVCNRRPAPARHVRAVDDEWKQSASSSELLVSHDQWRPLSRNGSSPVGLRHHREPMVRRLSLQDLVCRKHLSVEMQTLVENELIY